ncbi:DB module [Dictyocaulus viviparus]|uniref:DB module n=1 Tax=Dictyocaulus viviparus TaxID=29172 RepID=A0A0D8Y7I0_DICVI|nr:DB module [Dictyocaulus viviparus]
MTSFNYFTLILLITTVKSLTIDNIKASCPDDKAICAEKAANGQCFGTSLKSTVLRKKCKCSCDTVFYDRIQNCCRTIGEDDMDFCLPLCRYNTTTKELVSSLGLKCVSQLKTWAYCASDGSDQTTCCKKRGVSNECLPFCKGDVPTCDTESILNYQTCTKHMKTILQCQQEGLEAEPKYNPEWSSVCDWEGK